MCWCAIRRRCNNTRGRDYVNYGGRGITYDKAWDDFERFVADMGLPPDGLTIDRIDNDGPYSAQNCRWADRNTQSLNRRNAVLVEFAGKAMRLRAWAAYLGLPYGTVRTRHYRGQPLTGAVV